MNKAMNEEITRGKMGCLFNLSHDIRTPMNAILGFTRMAKKYIDDQDRVIDCLDKIGQSCDLLLQLIDCEPDTGGMECGITPL